MGFFITKKQQQVIKERRKKKVLYEKGLLPNASQQPSSGIDNNSNTNTNKTNKRIRSDTNRNDEVNDNDDDHKEEHQNSQEEAAAASSDDGKQMSSITIQGITMNYTTTTPSTMTTTKRSNTIAKYSNNDDQPPNNMKIVVTLPSSAVTKLSTKEMKKLRKDVRRQLLRNHSNNGNDRQGNTTDNHHEADDLVLFITEDENSRNNNTDTNGDLPVATKKIKRSSNKQYPCINELVRQQQQLEQQQNQLQLQQQASTQLDDEQNQDTNGTDLVHGSNNYLGIDTSQYVAIDCEMVGIGSNGRQSALARVSIVDWEYNVVLDTYVQVPMKVTDYRTAVSGIQPKHINIKNTKSISLTECRTIVTQLIKNKIIVGHSIHNDLNALLLTHPTTHIRDTAKYRPFQRHVGSNTTATTKKTKWRPRKLRDLVLEHCNLKIQQEGQSHDSIDDAVATMKLYQSVCTTWEKELVLLQNKKNQKK